MSRVLASFGAEWLKLRKRPAVWVLAAVLISLTVVLGYLVLLLFLATMPRNATLGPRVTAEALRQTLYPAHFLQSTLSNFSGGGLAGAMALILGVLVYGSEFGWGDAEDDLHAAARPARNVRGQGRGAGRAAGDLHGARLRGQRRVRGQPSEPPTEPRRPGPARWTS